MHKTSQKKALFLETYPKKNYNISKTCNAIGISRRTFYLWIEDDNQFEIDVEDLQEADLDDSEETLRVLRKGIPKFDKNGNFDGWLMRPDTASVIFHLKTKGKKRGYVEKTEVENTGTVINWIEEKTYEPENDIDNIDEVKDKE